MVHPVRPDGGLLAVHAHPDDETLSTGALLATWAAAGQPVTVVTCTRGEQGEVIARPGTPSAGLAHLEGDGPALAEHRRTELAAALASLGVRYHAFLDEVGAAGPRYEDSGMAWTAPGIAHAVDDAPPGAFVRVPLDEAAARLAAVVRERRPSVVVTYEPGGGYGHPDHVRAHLVAVRALEIVGREPGVRAPVLWESVVPDDVARAARRRLADLPGREALHAAHPELTLPDPDGQLPPMAKPSAQLRDALAVEVLPVLEALVGAMRAHATQIQHVGTLPPDGRAGSGETGPVVGWYALSNDVLAPIPSHEFYVPSGRVTPEHRTPWDATSNLDG